MPNLFLIQLIGVLMTGAGVVALTVSTYLYGTPISREDRRRAGRDERASGTFYRLPINLETVASALVLLGGVGILTWSKFELCLFLAHWLPELPDTLRLLLSCQ